MIGVLGWGICFNSFIRGEIGKPFRPGTIDDDGQSFIITSSLLEVIELREVSDGGDMIILGTIKESNALGELMSSITVELFTAESGLSLYITALQSRGELVRGGLTL